MSHAVFPVHAILRTEVPRNATDEQYTYKIHIHPVLDNDRETIIQQLWLSNGFAASMFLRQEEDTIMRSAVLHAVRAEIEVQQVQR
jgi:hypothetical protein